jgi:hypothetical protein
MAKRKPQRRQPARSTNRVEVRRSTDGRSWMLVHPRCARDRAEDLEEVEAMVEAREFDIATDELRWLISGCPEFIAAHRLLGDLALAAGNDVPLARGHYGAGYQVGLNTLRRAKMPAPLQFSQRANQPFFHAGRGLAWCLEKLGKSQMGEEVAATLVRLDPADPLKLRAMLDELRTGGAPVVDLLGPWSEHDQEGEA